MNSSAFSRHGTTTEPWQGLQSRSSRSVPSGHGRPTVKRHVPGPAVGSGQRERTFPMRLSACDGEASTGTSIRLPEIVSRITGADRTWPSRITAILRPMFSPVARRSFCWPVSVSSIRSGSVGAGVGSSAPQAVIPTRVARRTREVCRLLDPALEEMRTRASS